MAGVLPTPEEYAELAPRPGSPVSRNFNDVRMLNTSGYATLLQVAYPTVGYGVHQYSSFTKDPWGRLLRTLDYVHGTISGGPEMAGEIGARVRAMHTTIKGSMPDGERYHALEPEAFAWVHATLAMAIVHGREHFAQPMTLVEKQDLLDEWLGVGRFIGVRPRDLPSEWGSFEDYFETMVSERLEWTPAVPEVMDTLTNAQPPNVPGLRPGLWRVLRVPMSAQQRVATAGLLGPVLRERLGIPFTPRDRKAFRALSRVSKAAAPAIRGPLANFGPYYVRWRREALERGDVAAGKASRRDGAASPQMAQLK
jgi:uncharacterized protein (DUF2236 family)